MKPYPSSLNIYNHRVSERQALCFYVAEQVVDEETVEFPAVTVCNFNMMSKSRLMYQEKKNRTMLPQRMQQVLHLERRIDKKLIKGQIPPRVIFAMQRSSLFVLKDVTVSKEKRKREGKKKTRSNWN